MAAKKDIVMRGSDLAIGYSRGKKNERTVLGKLNFTLRTGELTCLLGANGAGKSTLLRTLSASQPPLGGSLFLKDKPLSTYSEKKLSTLIGVVLTDKTQAGGLTVYELVALGRQPHTGFFGKLHESDRKIIAQAMELVGISHKANNYTAELSDGERQKVMIAKALVQESPLIILDEPTAFLDVASRIEIMTLLHKLASEDNKAILLSTHDIEQALVLADRLWLMTDESLQCGVTEDLILNNAMDDLFGRKGISFDHAHGVYYPIVKGQKQIQVFAGSETLLHWTVNALNRHGYACHILAKKDDADRDLPIIETLSPHELFYTSIREERQMYLSFDEMLENL